MKDKGFLMLGLGGLLAWYLITRSGKVRCPICGEWVPRGEFANHMLTRHPEYYEPGLEEI